MKALVGSWDRPPHRLLAENAALRTRIAELQAELDRTRRETELLRAELRTRAEADVDIEIPVPTG